MPKKIKTEMTYDDDRYTIAANDIIRGKQTMTLQTARLIRLLITQIAMQDKDLKTYTCRIQDLATFLNVAPQNLYRDVRLICESAMKSVVYIGTGNPQEPWQMFHWMSAANYDGKGELTLRLSDEIKPYVLELDKWFTRYQLKNILEFNSYYAIRLYEIICCEEGQKHSGYGEGVEFTVDELRTLLDCEKKYHPFNNFNRKVIGVAVREINEKSDMKLRPVYKKKGRTITSIYFTFRPDKVVRTPDGKRAVVKNDG